MTGRQQMSEPTKAAKPAPYNKKRFTVLWTARGQDRRSALMTETEAQKFAARLRDEKADVVRIDEAVQPVRGTRR